jgi:hypothetical protein
MRRLASCKGWGIRLSREITIVRGHSMTRSACLAAASALALATVLSISIAGAQSVDDAGQRALRNAPVRPVLGQSGLFRIPLLTAVQKVSLEDAGAAGSTTSQPASGVQKLAKVEVEGDAKAPKLDAGPASEQKPPVETKPNDGAVVAKDSAKAVGLQPAAEAKADKAAEPPRAPVERQSAAEAKVGQQPAAPANAKEARAEAAPVNSAPSADRARVQAAQEQVPTGAAFTPRQTRNFGYGGYGYVGYDNGPIHNQQCDH